MPNPLAVPAILVLIVLSACATGKPAGSIDVEPGPEDFEYDPAYRRLIVASKPPVFVAIGDDGQLGAVTDAVPGDTSNLHMVGISLTPDGRLLYAINKKTNRIDVFDVTEQALEYRHSLPRDPRIRGKANEVFAVRENEVYVSNAQGSRLALIEALFRRPWANVLYFDGNGWREAAKGIRFGNGIQISADEKTLYVAGFQDRAIHVYARSSDGSLAETGLIPVGGSPDNLKWEDDARTRLLVASHPSQLRTFLHILTGGRTAARSEVRSVSVSPGDAAPRVIYPAPGQSGREINAASTAMLNGKHLYISQIVRPYLFHCIIP
jgi:arylesterase / paraoxonase